jgi:hypothetical protein
MPDLGVTPRFMDEITAGFQHQVGNVMGLGVRVISRRWENFIDDVRGFDESGSITRVVQNVAGGQRTYRGVEITLDKRFSSNWSASGSYTWSESRGNHFGDDFTALGDFAGATCKQEAGDARLGDPDGRFPCAEVQARLSGRPAFDRPHLAKFAAAFRQPIGPVDLTAGVVGAASSKATFSKERIVSVLIPGSADVQATTLTYYYDGLGSERIPGIAFTADVAVEAAYRAAGRSEIGVKFEAFNLLNSEDKIAVDNTAWCSSTASGACSEAVSTFGTATNRGSFLTPRTYRVTFLIRF